MLLCMVSDWVALDYVDHQQKKTFTVTHIHRNWRDDRINKRNSVSQLARTAVRVSEAACVRPILKERMANTINTFLNVDKSNREQERKRGATEENVSSILRDPFQRMLLYRGL